MVEISQNVNIEMLEKLPDGTYKRKYPKTRADDGTTFDEHLADLASQEVGKGASLIGLNDSSNKFTATNVEGAMEELFTNVSNGKQSIATAITGKGVTANGGDTFGQLASKITSIPIGAKIKSIQYGTTSLEDGSGTTSSTISKVDVNKSIILVNLESGHKPDSYLSANAVNGYLNTNGRSIQFRRRNDSGSVTVAWQVIEFEDGVTVRSAYGQSPTGNTTPTVSYSYPAINLAKSFMIYNVSRGYSNDYIAGVYEEVDFGRTSTELSKKVFSSSDYFYYYIAVVTFD